MIAPIYASSNVLQQYRKHPSSGPRDLTPAMVCSIDEADKPAKRGNKPETHKEAQVSKPIKGKTPRKRKSDKAVTSPPQPKKLKKPAWRLILQSLSDSDSKSKLEATRQAIEAANTSLYANFNDQLTQLEAELAVENCIMDELDRRTSQLKMKNYKLRTANTELNDLNSEKEVIRTSVDDKINLSENELEEKLKKQQAELEQKRKETELLEKKISMFPVCIAVSL
ncbi:unnamed protein product [Lactuca saligna]|uniref:Uncharacterized protein n=1 Tax=Lactuca saligna TaxID=75948 RepID=A0AA35W0U6_LACSI|nr:unnamed protein product [Lactuca saligna]